MELAQGDTFVQIPGQKSACVLMPLFPVWIYWSCIYEASIIFPINIHNPGVFLLITICSQEIFVKNRSSLNWSFSDIMTGRVG